MAFLLQTETALHETTSSERAASQENGDGRRLTSSGRAVDLFVSFSRALIFCVGPVALSACTSFLPPAWPSLATGSPKPPNPLVAPSDKALLVVVADNMGHLAGPQLIFDENRQALTQLPHDRTGWSVAPMSPGRHTIYRSDSVGQCDAFEGDFAAGKVYVLPLRGGLSERWSAASDKSSVVASLHFFDHFVVDPAALAALLESHRSQVDACMGVAVGETARAVYRASGRQPATLDGGFDALDFVTPTKP